MKSKPHIKKYCTVIIVDGQHILQTPNGEILEGILETVVTDNSDELPIAVVKMTVNIGLPSDNQQIIDFKKKATY